MEDILASIRRIISEDDPAAAKAAPPAAAPAAAPAPPSPAARNAASEAELQAAVPAASAEDDVLVLTEEVAGDEPTQGLAEALPREPQPPSLERAPESLADVLEPRLAGPEPEPPVAELPAAAPEAPAADTPLAREADEPPPPLAAPEQPAPASGGLLSDRAAAAAVSAFTELITRSHREPNIESLPMGQSDKTLEDITRDLLRPILKSWLDENLPPIVERIVREEIGRLALDAQRR